MPTVGGSSKTNHKNTKTITKINNLYMKRAYDIKRTEERLKRVERLKALKAQGKTYQQIADHEGISRQRAHMLLNDYGNDHPYAPKNPPIKE